MENKISYDRILGPMVTPNPHQNQYKIGNEKGDKTSFSEMLKGFVGDVNHMQNKSGHAIQKMIAGEVKDPHQVMLAVGEAKMALNLLIEVRNKTMEAYREIINIRA